MTLLPGGETLSCDTSRKIGNSEMLLPVLNLILYLLLIRYWSHSLKILFPLYPLEDVCLIIVVLEIA